MMLVLLHLPKGINFQNGYVEAFTKEYRNLGGEETVISVEIKICFIHLVLVFLEIFF